METKGIFIGEALKAGWAVMQKHLGFFIGIILFTSILETIPFVISNLAIENNHPYVNLIVVIAYAVYIVLMILFTMGFVKISLSFVDGEKGRFRDLFTSFPLFFKFLIAEILFSLLMVAGLILLVFPMFIWGIRYSLFPYFIVEKKLGPINAFKESAKTTMGAKWDLFGFEFAAFVVALIGIICLFIGLFAAIPIVLVAKAFIYRKLLAQTK